MLRLRRVIPLIGALVVAAAVVAMLAVTWRGPNMVSKKSQDLIAYDVAEPRPLERMAQPMMAAAPPPPEEIPQGGPAGTPVINPIVVGIPRLAYAYKLGFRIANDRLAAAQEAHIRMCETMGPARCQLLGIERGAYEDSQTPAQLKLRVATSEARRFTADAVRAVSAEGGRAIQTKMTAEDVSKAMVDAEARIRQREMLVSRLTEILRTRSGKVAELVEAERSVAQAQEELDQTRGWLTELRARVAMSDFEISYQAVAPGAAPSTAGGRVGEALQGSIVALATAVQILVVLAIYLLPWGLIGLLAWLGWRRWGRQGVVGEAVATS